VFDLYAITAERTPAEIERGVLRVLAHEQSARIAILLRAKHLSAADRLSLGRALRAITNEAGALLLVSADLELCEELGADGVQLPERGPSVERARQALHPRRWVGASRHDGAGLASAAGAGASFATLSPVYASPGKGAPLGDAAFAELASRAELPVLALGGIEARHVGDLIAAGAAGIAVIRAVFDQPDPCAAAQSFLTEIDHARASKAAKASGRSL
jgi:thiamine-phosphate pyrophosphorylase